MTERLPIRLPALTTPRIPTAISRTGRGGGTSKAAIADARRAERIAAFFARGVHPITGLPLNEAERCGTCAHLVATGRSSRRFFKCDLVPMTSGPGTDVRKKWTACTRWEATDG